MLFAAGAHHASDEMSASSHLFSLFVPSRSSCVWNSCSASRCEIVMQVIPRSRACVTGPARLRCKVNARWPWHTVTPARSSFPAGGAQLRAYLLVESGFDIDAHGGRALIENTKVGAVVEQPCHPNPLLLAQRKDIFPPERRAPATFARREVADACQLKQLLRAIGSSKGPATTGCWCRAHSTDARK